MTCPPSARSGPRSPASSRPAPAGWTPYPARPSAMRRVSVDLPRPGLPSTNIDGLEISLARMEPADRVAAHGRAVTRLLRPSGRRSSGCRCRPRTATVRRPAPSYRATRPEPAGRSSSHRPDRASPAASGACPGATDRPASSSSCSLLTPQMSLCLSWSQGLPEPGRDGQVALEYDAQRQGGHERGVLRAVRRPEQDARGGARDCRWQRPCQESARPSSPFRSRPCRS